MLLRTWSVPLARLLLCGNRLNLFPDLDDLVALGAVGFDALFHFRRAQAFSNRFVQALHDFRRLSDYARGHFKYKVLDTFIPALIEHATPIVVDSSPMDRRLYDDDFYAWTQEQAELLRSLPSIGTSP